MMAKPFLQWAGGKSRLLPILDASLPIALKQQKDWVYVEPFVGAGAMFFHLLQHYPIRRAVINDLNRELMITYRIIRNDPRQLIEGLQTLRDHYGSLPDLEAKRAFFLLLRDAFNRKKNS